MEERTADDPVARPLLRRPLALGRAILALAARDDPERVVRHRPLELKRCRRGEPSRPGIAAGAAALIWRLSQRNATPVSVASAGRAALEWLRQKAAARVLVRSGRLKPRHEAWSAHPARRFSPLCPVGIGFPLFAERLQ
jgi:hypothetical protein